MWNWSEAKLSLSSSSNAVVCKTFLVRCFFYLSLNHAPVFHRSMRILWMQRNIWCITAATFKMITMSSACSASALSAVKAKQTRVTAADSCEPRTLRHIKPAPLNQPEILLITEPHRCPHIGHQVWISVNEPSRSILIWSTSWSTNAEKRRRTCVKMAVIV